MAGIKGWTKAAGDFAEEDRPALTAGLRPRRPETAAGNAATASRSEELERLLRRMSEKDEAAFEQLYASTKRKLFSIVLLTVRRWDLAEEVVQEAYVRIWLNAASYRPALGSPMLWMITIARNLAIDLARKPNREIRSDDRVLSAFPADSPTALETIESREEQGCALNHQLHVFYALQALDPARRDLVIGAYVRGESRKQLAERCGVPVNTVKTWIRRALLETRANLAKAGAEPVSSLQEADGLAGPEAGLAHHWHIARSLR